MATEPELQIEPLPTPRGDAVRRSGDTVRRQAGPWTPAVHALLGHLEQVGFDAAPRVLGIEGDEEILSYVEGVDGHHARSPELHDDACLAEVGRLVRRLHDATATFDPPPEARWQFLAGAPREGVLCHNDIAPVNIVYREGRPVALIDWDYAAPAPALWDVACAVWSCVPLADDEFCERYGYPAARRPERLRIFCDAYGLTPEARTSLLDVVRARQLAMVDTIRLGAEAGNADYARVWAANRAQRWLDAVAFLDVHRTELQAALS